MLNFSKSILAWYKVNKRDLPWRNTGNPYFIWLSEVILQQTRVDQGLPYYRRFVKAFPTARKLAEAKEEEVLKLWQGLGYYSRARNLHHAAKEIVKKHKGKFPATYEDIRALKGVGDYTAAAIASFAFNLPYATVDGNVYRLLSRYHGIRTPVNSSKAKKEFTAAAQELMGNSAPQDFNQAMMEFGSRQCKPSNPDCENCPLVTSCMAYEKKLVKKLPVKNKNRKPTPRYFHYLHIEQGSFTWIRKRTDTDIWKNLYEFPMMETKKKMTERTLYSDKKWLALVPRDAILLNAKTTFIHQLSHQTIYATFHRLKLKDKSKFGMKGAKRIRQKDIGRLPVHRLVDKYLESAS